MGSEDRGTAMAASVARAARTVGVSLEGVAALSRAHALAMEPRRAKLSHDRDPAYLHPGHSVLILIRDVGCVDSATLAATALVESEDPWLRVSTDAIRRVLGDDVASFVESVPLPDSETLAYDLVTAVEGVRLAALAERLDHLRHGHLRSADRSWRVAALAQARSIYLPVAQRTHPRLAQRYEHWCRAFARRLARE